jgi:hypothetical protein
VESKLGPLRTSATEWPIVSAPGDYDGEFGGMEIGRGNRNTRRKPAPAPLCPPQIPFDQARVWTPAAAVGSQRLTAWAMTRPMLFIKYIIKRRNRYILPLILLARFLLLISVGRLQISCLKFTWFLLLYYKRPQRLHYILIKLLFTTFSTLLLDTLRHMQLIQRHWIHKNDNRESVLPCITRTAEILNVMWKYFSLEVKLCTFLSFKL